MPKRILVGVLLACALVLMWMLRAEAPIPPASPAEAAPQIADEPIEIKREVFAPRPAEPRSPVEREALAPEPAAATAATVPEQAVAPKIDKQARDWIHLIVVDEGAAPVANAEIVMTGLRRKRERSTHYSWRPETSLGQTAPDGSAKLWYPVWVDADDEAGELTFEIKHPDFVTKKVDHFTVGPGARVIVLERGSFVVVSGWIERPGERITDVVPHLSRDVKIGPDAWAPLRDGRPSTANIPPGEHVIYLSHQSAEHGRRFSAATPFTLAKGEQKEIHLELLPGIELRGRLEDEVPRPVVNGTVLVNLGIGAQGRGPATMLRIYTAAIATDGSFTFDLLPPGEGQIIALCNGWSSERVVPADLALLGITSTDPAEIGRAIAERGEDARLPQFVEPGAVKEFVLRMELTATLKAIVRGPDGTPVAGARVSVWPNVFWKAGSSQLFLQREYAATSDASGELSIPDLPPDDATSYGVEHPKLDLPIGGAYARHTREATLVSDETLEVVLDLEAKAKD